MAELTTVSLVKTYAGISGTADDTVLTNLLESAERRIRGWCNRPDGWLNTSAHTEKVPGSTFDNLPLIYSPVTAITTVKVFSSSGSSITVASTEYRINDEQNAVLLSGGWKLAWDAGWDVGQWEAVEGAPTRVRAYPYVEVVYTGGYANQAAIPDDLEQVANELTMHLFNKRKRDHSESVFLDRAGSEYFKTLLHEGGWIRQIGVA